jgi:serine/threonine protein kinase
MVEHKTYDGPPVGDNKEILRQITSGLAHLHHSHRVVHRDLKPANILISSSSEFMKPLMKLADFGQSRHKKDFSLSQSFKRTLFSNGEVRRFGTPCWMAPEIANEEATYTFFSDIFPLGIIFAYTLNDGKHPFGDDEKTIIDRIEKKEGIDDVKQDKDKFKEEKESSTVQGEFKEELDKKFPKAFELIKNMLNPEPKQRPKAKDVLNNSFFTSQ